MRAGSAGRGVGGEHGQADRATGWGAGGRSTVSLTVLGARRALLVGVLALAGCATGGGGARHGYDQTPYFPSLMKTAETMPLDYRERLTAALDRQWKKDLAALPCPPDGSQATVSFTLNAKGEVSDFSPREEPASSAEGRALAVRVITAAAPYEAWTEAMQAALGEHTAMTCQFCYAGPNPDAGTAITTPPPPAATPAGGGEGPAKGGEGLAGLGPGPMNARWGNHAAYLQRLITAVDRRWNKIMTGRRRLNIPAGTQVSVTFIFNQMGEVSRIMKVDTTSTDAGTKACVEAIVSGATRELWKTAMRADLGTETEMTFSFYYQ